MTHYAVRSKVACSLISALGCLLSVAALSLFRAGGSLSEPDDAGTSRNLYQWRDCTTNDEFLADTWAEKWSRAVFPELPLQDYCAAAVTKGDILLFVPTVPFRQHAFAKEAFQTFPGFKLFFDGEPNSWMQLAVCKQGFQDEKLIYFGPSCDTDVTVGVTRFEPYIHLGAVLLNYPRSANDFVPLSSRRVNLAHRQGFAAYAHSNCLAHREAAFDNLVLMAERLGFPKPSALAPCHGSYPGTAVETSPSREDRMNNFMMFRSFRFTLVMENELKSGYISEKIAQPLFGRSIPIYYGTKEIFDVFNEHAIIYYDIHDPEPALLLIEHLETNATAYKRMLARPVLKDGERTLENYFSFSDEIGGGKLKQKVRNLVGL